MKLAFCLFNYFPYGGLQRDFLRIAKECVRRGHEVHVFTMSWQGERESAFHLHLVSAKGWSNHGKAAAFARQVKAALIREHYDRVIGFNKMPHLDVYYAADVCYQSRMKKERSVWNRLTPRYRTWIKMENAVFAFGSAAKILLISPRQQQDYHACYGTEPERFHILPPGISKDRVAPANAAEIRDQMRATYLIPPDHLIMLMVGSGFWTKGLDRVILSFAALSEPLRSRCHLWVIGQDDAAPFRKQAMELGVHARAHFFGGRPDVPRYLLASDMLLHPAHHENTGTVLLEALVSGLPVLTVDVCGYAPYVTEANAGEVLRGPFDQARWNVAVEKSLLSPERTAWRENGLAFAQTADIYQLPEKAVDVIELTGRKRDVLS